MMKNKLKQLLKDEKGFTLIEMIVVLFIVSLLMLLVIPGVMNQQEKATEKGNAALESVLQSQVDLYHLDKDEVPLSFTLMQEKGYLTEKQKIEADKNFTLTGSVVTIKKAGP